LDLVTLFGENKRSLDPVLQLSHIPGPEIVLQHVDGFPAEHFLRDLFLPAKDF
jgi:hypothetical protein